MYQSLERTRLRTGERVRIGCVLGPDPQYREVLVPLLGHKGDLWQWHIEEALDRPLEDLQTRFYIAEVDDRVLCNVCTFERGPVGILGHVFTRPDQRRKGLASAVVQVVVEDFHHRGGEILTLGTTYGTSAYRIYEARGFSSIMPGSGVMQNNRAPDSEARYWSPREVTAAPVTWGDWAGTSLLMQQPGPAVRSVAFETTGREDFESGFLHVQSHLQKELEASAAVLRGDNGSVLGFATMAKDYRWPGSVWLLDHFVRPGCEPVRVRRLLETLRWPSGKVQAYLDADHPSIPVLADLGFEREGLFRSQFRNENRWVDLGVYSRHNP